MTDSSTSTPNNTAPWCTPSDGAFEHRFSGYSVWLEPAPPRPLQTTMEFLSNQCGGPQCGLHPFAPHLTLLYNIQLGDRVFDGNGDAGIVNGENDDVCDATVSRAKDLLRKCLMEYRRINSATSANDTDTAKETINMNATSYYYFPYPKSADDGRGFGCVISMLLIEKSRQLEALHDAVTSTFPPDERHGEAGGTFQPHMALVYAPEHCGPSLEEWTNAREAYEQKAQSLEDCLLGEMPAKSISLWKTEGTIDKWKRISSLDLDDFLS